VREECGCMVEGGVEGRRKEGGRDLMGGGDSKCYTCTHVSPSTHIFLHRSVPSLPHLPVLQLPCPGTSCGVIDTLHQNIHYISLHCPIRIELWVHGESVHYVCELPQQPEKLSLGTPPPTLCAC